MISAAEEGKGRKHLKNVLIDNTDWRCSHGRRMASRAAVEPARQTDISRANDSAVNEMHPYPLIDTGCLLIVNDSESVSGHLVAARTTTKQSKRRKMEKLTMDG